MMSQPARARPSERLHLAVVDARARGVETMWRALEAGAAPPYFLTWGWIENWIACLPLDETPELTLVFDGATPIAGFFLGRARLVRHHLFRSRGLFLNATGHERRDALCIEHNAVLCAPGASCSLASLVRLLPPDWDELFLPALSRRRFPGDALDEPLPDGLRLRIDDAARSPYVDLARVRARRGDYLALLGASTRAQIRRARRGFGALFVEVAHDLPSAFSIYDELVELHAQRWHERGEPGAFADPWFDAFHRRLIAARFAAGEIQLMRVRAAGQTIGCLYNFVANGRVLFYQSGLRQYDDPHLKPGYVCHAEAVRHNAATGQAIYDLLGANGRYKECLATDADELVWARVQRPLRRFAVEDWLRDQKRALSRLFHRAPRPALPAPPTPIS